MAVKIMIKRTIPQGASRHLFLLLLEQMRSIASIQPGYFYGETLQSESNTEVVIVISTWKSIHSWHSWVECRERMILQSKIDAILGTPTEYAVYCHMGSTEYEIASVSSSAGKPEDPPVDLPQACFSIDPAYGSAAMWNKKKFLSPLRGERSDGGRHCRPRPPSTPGSSNPFHWQSSEIDPSPKGGTNVFTIVNRQEMAKGTIILNEIQAPAIAAKALPGQFVILKADETGERIPLTIADSDVSKGTITIIYMVVGKSTAKFKALNIGDHYMDVIGPLGKPTHIEKLGHVVCVGGGTGIAVLHPITRGLKQAGNQVTSIIGARSKDLLILEDRMRAVSDLLHVATDDGSLGHHGFVTDILQRVLESTFVKLVVGIGPVPMMKFVCKIAKEFDVPALVSLNPIMVDGTGMCGGCRVTVSGQTRFACVDGPEFDGHAVDFDELSQRLRAYGEDEKRCYDEHCRLFS